MRVKKIFFENLISSFNWHSKKSKKRLMYPSQNIDVIYNGKTNIFLFFTTIFICFFFFLLINLFIVQVLKGVEYRRLADNNKIRVLTLRPERGVIFDTNNKIIASNKLGFKLMLDASQVQASLIKNLEATVNKFLEEKVEIEKQFYFANEADIRNIVLKPNITQKEAISIESHLKELPGIFIESEPKRDYLFPQELAHVLGYVAEASQEDLKKGDLAGGGLVGKTGLEFIYDNFLRGKKGQKIFEINAQGEEVRLLKEDLPEAGASLVLTIDAELQEKVFEALQKQMILSKANAGVSIVQDINTGAVLSLVVIPSFDPNFFVRAGLTQQEVQSVLENPRKPLFNRAISGLYPPGSIFKLVTALAGLEENIITKSSFIDDKGGISIGSFVYRDWKEGGHGVVNLEKAIAQSCDTFFYILGGGYQGIKGLGVEKLSKWAKILGLGKETEIDLLGEKKGLVPDPDWKQKMKNEPWYLGNTYHLAIGQGDILVTPLQINNLTVAIANGGYLLKPFLVKEIRNSKEEALKIFGKRILKQDFSSKENINLIKEGMRGAVLPGGTAYPLRYLKVAAAAKTGTAESTAFENTHAWMTAFAPYESPEIAITVLLESGGEGSDDAGPVVQAVFEYYFHETEMQE